MKSTGSPYKYSLSLTIAGLLLVGAWYVLAGVGLFDGQLAQWVGVVLIFLMVIPGIVIACMGLAKLTAIARRQAKREAKS
jgi:hypothetical protein